jgi:hypothetical protein
MVVRLTEKWDLRRLERVVNRMDTDTSPQERSAVLSVLHRVTPDGSLQVDYKHGKTISFGRKYANGLQRISTRIRRLCGGKTYQDIDIVNCFCVLLEQIVGKYLGKHQTLELSKYIQRREEQLKHVQDRLDIGRASAKDLFLGALHSGNYRSSSPP